MKRDNEKERKPTTNGGVPKDIDLAAQKKIALRAYELYLQRGGVAGHAEDDWLQAEREVLSNQKR